MAYRIVYHYQEYKNCPEATEISRERARESSTFSFVYNALVGGSFLVGIVSLFGKKTVIGLALIASAILLFLLELYFSSKFQKRTEKLINEAFDRQKIKTEKRKELFLKHDVDGLIALNEGTSRWYSAADVKKDYELHLLWLQGKPAGKQWVMAGEVVRNANLTNKCFYKAVFSHCLFDNMNLSGVQFRDCDLKYCRFKRCQMKDTIIDNSDTEGVQFVDCEN